MAGRSIDKRVDRGAISTRPMSTRGQSRRTTGPHPASWFMVADPAAAEFRARGSTDPRASRQIVGPIELLAEVPIAPSLRGIRPIPAHVQRRRRRHRGGGNDSAQRETVKDAPVVGLPDPRPHGPHDLGGLRGHSAAPGHRAALGHRDMGPSGCDGAMSNRDVTGSDRDASMSACDVTGSDLGASMSNHDVTGYRAIFA